MDKLGTAYGVSDEQLLQGLPELLRGDALQWYRNLASECHTWAHFEESLRGFYLSPAERRLLSRQVAERVQRPQEAIRSYVTTLRTLMRRTAQEEQLDNLYYGMRPEYRLHIRRQVLDVASLVQLVEEHDAILHEVRKEQKVTLPVHQPSAVMTAGGSAQYHRKDHCWRCKQRGHSRAECRNTPRLICSVCGKDGV